MISSPPSHQQWLNVAGNQPRSAFVPQVEPRPLRHYDDTAAETGQVEDVDHEPRGPRDETRQSESANFDHGASAPDGRDHAFVEVAKWLNRFAPNEMGDVARCMAALLHRMSGAAGHDQIVEWQLCIAQCDCLSDRVDGQRFTENHPSGRLMVHDVSYRHRNVGWTQGGARYLVEQRLKYKMIATIDDRKTHRFTTKQVCGRKTGEAAAKDDNMRPSFRGRPRGNCGCR